MSEETNRSTDEERRKRAWERTIRSVNYLDLDQRRELIRRVQSTVDQADRMSARQQQRRLEDRA